MNKRVFWSKLDNAAKIYPILTSERFTYVFRVSATLKEQVNKDILYKAILESKKRFPSFYVRLKRGIFWYYFEENLKNPTLHEETAYVCKKLDEIHNNRYLFQFLYYNNRISLEINHVLTDGAGAIMFLKSVVYHYLFLLGKEVIPDKSVLLIDEQVNESEIEDSYGQNYSGGKIDPPKVPKAYFYKKKMLKKSGSGIINSFIDTNELLNFVKSQDTTLTQYIVSLLIYSIIKNGNEKKLKKHPVNICVPINLRNTYNSITLNNFSLYFHVSYLAKSKNPDFEDILKTVKIRFSEENTKEKIQSKIDTIYQIQNKYFIRLIPLPIKWIMFKIGYMAFGRKPTTVTFSNFGKVTIPKSLEKYIDSFSFYMGSGQKHAIAMNSYKDKTSIVFSRAIIDTDLEKTFFNYLTQNKIRVSIVSNYWENKA